MQDLTDRVAWITGAGSGIGLALAHRLAAERMKLVLVDIDADRLAAAEAALRDHARVVAIRADVSNADDVVAAARRALDAFGLVHVICNNAGIGGNAGPLWETTEADWQRMIDINLFGVVRGIRALLPPLLASGEPGHVVNTASIAGLTATPYLGAYTASKHAVVALSECLAKELELARANVGVSVVCPGFVKTNITLSHEQKSRIAQAFDQMVASGIAAEVVADAIVAAIREPRFYVLTHPHMTKQIEHRMRQILDGKQPGIDPLLRSLFAG
jgi:NAD(P)-dependent dehydrogenase (short-subunit alcohol dehydrogenase family)